MYTNIPHKDGIAACAQALQDTDPDSLCSPIEILVEMLNIVLKNNVIEFNNKFFLQLQSTAMRMKMAPAYANLFMGSIEETLKNIDRDHINIWKRFINDIFVIWTGSQAQLTTFITQINQVHQTIKFTLKYTLNRQINNYTSTEHPTTQKLPFQKEKFKDTSGRTLGQTHSKI